MPKSTAATQEISLTTKEQEAIMDRLQLSDCIADALTDVPEGEEPPVPESREAVMARVDILCRLIGGEARTVPPIHTGLDKAILVDAIEGSTWAASLEHREAAAARRVLTRLAEKMIDAGFAEHINIPAA